MPILYVIGFLIMGVVGTNILKKYFPKVPEPFILICLGIAMSFTKAFQNFELEPEFFMLIVIAPLMFVDGQRQSFAKIRSRFKLIVTLSVVLAVVTVVIVGSVTNLIEVAWTLPLAMALAAIVTPTDAVAVSSMTSSSQMPEGVNQALELESLFNDATGLVILDLALTVLGNQSLSVADGIGRFMFVAVGGIAVGLFLGWLIVLLRVRLSLNINIDHPEYSVIPVSLLTPFVVYLVAEHLGMSGILAVVATGIIHNWESNRLRLSATQVQISQRVIWDTISNILNSVVFLILGITLPTVARSIVKMVPGELLGLVGLAMIIYISMLLVRYFWALWEHEGSAVQLLGAKDVQQHYFYSKIFAISGIHGTMTLAMAFSLPQVINGQAFPFRDQVILVATMVILISMLVSAIALPRLLPAKVENYSSDALEVVRGKMVDYAILQMHDQIPDHAVREALSQQLQSQKGWGTVDRDQLTQDYQNGMLEIKDFISDFIHSPDVLQKYSRLTILLFEKFVDRIQVEKLPKHHQFWWFKKIKHRLKHTRRKIRWDVQLQRDPKQRQKMMEMRQLRQQWQEVSSHEETRQLKLQMQQEVTDLTNEVIDASDQKLDQMLKERLQAKHGDNQYIDVMRQNLDRYFQKMQRNFKSDVQINSDLFIQAFQYEMTYVRQLVQNDIIPQALAAELYDEINQAQSLQIQQLNDTNVAESTPLTAIEASN